MRFLAVLILSLLQFALASSISGFIRDTTNGEPIPFASVVIPALDRGSATDVHGYYLIPKLPTGSTTLKIMMIGYEILETEVFLEDTHLRKDFSLQPRRIDMDVVTVSGERTQFDSQLDISRVQLSNQDLRLAPAFVEDDVFRTFQLLPSVTSLNDFSAALIVRGGSPDENLVNLDGTQIYNPYHIGGIFSTFNTDAISSAEFLAGGFQSEFGGHLSSVINLTTKEGNSVAGRLPQDHWLKKFADFSNGQVEISPLSSKILLEGPSYKGSWFFSGRRTFMDKFVDLYYKTVDEDQPGNYYFWDMNLKVHSDLNHEHRLTYSQYSGRDALFVNVGGEDFPEIDFNWVWGNRTNSLNWRYLPSREYLLETHISRAEYYFDVDFQFTVERESSFTDSTESTGYRAVMKNLVRDRTVDQQMTWFPSEEHTLQMGWNFKVLSMEYKEKFAGSTIIHLKQSPYIFAAYAKETWRPHPLLAIELGFRASKYELYDSWLVDPRLNIRYNLTSDLVVKGAWGQFSQFLFTVNKDDQLLRVVDFWQPISEKHKPQRAQHVVLGAEYWAGKGITYAVDLYYKPYSNILDMSRVYHPSDGDVGFVSGTADSYGVEILIRKTRGRIFGWAGYSWSFTERSLDYNKNGVLEAELGEVHRAKYDIPHSLNLVVNYRLNDIHTLGSSLVIHSGQPFTPPQGKVFHQDQLIFGSMDNPFQRFDSYYAAQNSARYPTYFRLDVSYTKTIAPFGLQGMFKVQLMNLTNSFNVLLYNWQLDDSPARATAYSMFPILLTMGWEFEI